MGSMMKVIDITGQRFGRLVVIKKCEKINNRTGWECICDCGSIKKVQTNHLKQAQIKSCGCLDAEKARERAIKRNIKNTVHGHCKSTKERTPTYLTWFNMRQRCNNEKSINYIYYGKRGIKVCERWDTFEKFLEDMGERPAGKTIDRIDVNGNYEQSNCRWATVKEQSVNKRNSKQ